MLNRAGSYVFEVAHGLQVGEDEDDEDGDGELGRPRKRHLTEAERRKRAAEAAARARAAGVDEDEEEEEEDDEGDLSDVVAEDDGDDVAPEDAEAVRDLHRYAVAANGVSGS